jgi:hypothetical protein
MAPSGLDHFKVISGRPPSRALRGVQAFEQIFLSALTNAQESLAIDLICAIN